MTHAPVLSPGARGGILALLAVAMLATRLHHFAAVPDASWAVFFIAGFYLRGWGRWAFPMLMALAVAIDYAVITGQGIAFWSHYCMSTAYLFLLPAYAAPWLGGSWLRKHYEGPGLRELGMLAGSSVLAASLCFLVSNGSFYWISANVPARSFGGWFENMGDWYLSYLGTTLVYVGVAAVLHVATAFAARALAGVASDARTARF
ncbi:MAG: hypothetical protein EOP90_10455 [Lysobacteraceae bacterium]|nr:MAG: hypothetical protein EOP90_10455 [Xanthomonadaceae bacterium]